MRELLRTNDPVLLSYVETLLSDAGLEAVVLDRYISAAEGSIGILPRRVLLPQSQWRSACRVLEEAGLETWIKTDDTG